jgi:DNA polymerase III epsilon subunit-like protein
MGPPSLAFTDVETTGLDPGRHEVWEVALVIDEGAYVWQLPVDLGRAEPAALGLGHFYDRRSEDLTPHAEFADVFSRLTWGCHLAGACVSFDAERLALLLRANGACPGWHHRILDVEAYAAGALGLPAPIGLRDTAARLGVEVAEGELHTALGDAQLARAVYEAAHDRRRSG